MNKPQLSPRKTEIRAINTRLEAILQDIKVQQKALVVLKEEALKMAKQEREKANFLSSRRPAKKGRRRVTRQPKLKALCDPLEIKRSRKIIH